jgi:tetratricopeptide (TPR) repeat protein
LAHNTFFSQLAPVVGSFCSPKIERPPNTGSSKIILMNQFVLDNVLIMKGLIPTLKKMVQQFREKNPYYHFDLGLKASRQGNYEEALGHFKRAAQLNSRDHTFYFEIARTYARIGKKKQVLSNLQLAVKYAFESDNKLKYEQKLEALRNNYSQAN